MARAGDVLENPSSGDRLTFLRTAAETGGELLEYELEFVPRGFAARDLRNLADRGMKRVGSGLAIDQDV